jgi:hypothetical protein
MEFTTISFVEKSKLFDGCDLAWDTFINNEPDYQRISLGYYEHVLIDVGYIESRLRNHEVDDDDSGELLEQIATVLQRSKDQSFLVDLEN